MTIRSRKIINHAAIYLGLVDFQGRKPVPVILHHVQNQLSGKTVYGGYWALNTRKVIRHKSFFASGGSFKINMDERRIIC